MISAEADHFYEQEMKREHYVTTTGFLDHIRAELDKKVRTY